jgi:ribonuclease P protein component
MNTDKPGAVEPQPNRQFRQSRQAGRRLAVIGVIGGSRAFSWRLGALAVISDCGLGVLCYGEVMRTHAFGPHEKLKRRRDFERVTKEGRSLSDGLLRMRAAPNALPHGRLGIIVSKRMSRLSPERNRMKRLIREAYRLHKPALAPSTDWIVIPKGNLSRNTLREVEDSLLKLARRYAEALVPRPPGPEA